MHDEALSADIRRVHREHFGVYGVRKPRRVLRREGIEVGRDRVGRLIRALGLAGATRTKRIRTTKPAAVGERPADFVERVFTAPAPNRFWVADLTYVWTRAGFVERVDCLVPVAACPVGTVGVRITPRRGVGDDQRPTAHCLTFAVSARVRNASENCPRGMAW